MCNCFAHKCKEQFATANRNQLSSSSVRKARIGTNEIMSSYGSTQSKR
jgi:hypothetical protein